MFKYNGLIFAYIAMLMCFSQVNADPLDPTRPLGYGHSISNVVSNKEQITIVLNSILTANDRKVAIINGQQLHEGDVIKGVGAEVKKIESDAVTLQQSGKIWRLPLNTTTIRK